MGDSSEAQEHAGGTSNGVSAAIAADRAAFIARDTEAKTTAPPAEDKTGKTVAADDSDLDDDGDELDAAAGDDEDADLEGDDEERAATSDDDSDLDEDEDEDEEADDADTKKRLASVRRTDQRLREQRERQWKERDADLATRESKLAEREAKIPKLERLVERLKNPYELADVLAELGYSEDDFEPASQVTFARTKKFAGDPNAKATVAKLKAEREQAERLAKLEKRDAERDQAERDREAQAAAEQKVVAFIASATKATTDKTPLAAALIEKNPARAQVQIAEITGRYMDEHGAMPTPKQVIIALEKSRRQDLRDLGVDPRSITTVAAAKKQTDAPVDKTKSAAATKKSAPAGPAAKTDETKTKSLTKDNFINRKFD